MNDDRKPRPRVATKAMIERLYDDAASLYDRTGPGIFARFGARLVEHLPVSPGARVLDVATGNGAVLLPLARRAGPEGRVTGIDLSATILHEARSAVSAAGLTNVELRKMDAEHLEFADGAFDIVTCALSLFLMSDIDAALCEIHRVCKPDGYVGVSFFDKRPPPFDPGWPILLQQFMEYQTGVRMPQPVVHAPQEVEALLARAGFHSITAHSEASEIVYPTLDDWWRFQLTVGTRLSIQSMDEETRAKFKDEYLRRLRPLMSEDGLQVRVAVVYGVARR
ncbi:MAG: methyltransferase domain-containing protein [Dehalococcoidia bacterium]|nr:methyltransferase domain-containing protein [Dehalococcoidia bacterium]